MDTSATDPSTTYMGGLDPREDGQFAYIWQDDAMQVNAAFLFDQVERMCSSDHGLV